MDAWPNIPSIICHDQEPLDYDYYSPSKINDVFAKKILNHYPNLCKNTITRSLDSSLTTLNHIKEPSIYDNTLILHSEKNSREITKYQSAEFITVYYWSHAIIARDWFRHAEIDPLLNRKLITQDFLIYNRAWSGTREYRLKFIELLVDQDLVRNCKTKFNPADQGQLYQSHQFCNTELSISRFDLESFFPNNCTPSSASADYTAQDYQSCGIEVVLETLFDDDRLHLTEKTLRPIACKQPFILAATPNSLEYLKSYGFKTFGEIIDESYDSIQNPLDRLGAIVNLMKSIAAMSGTQKEIMYEKMHKICEHNHARFFSKDFQQQVILEFQQNINQAIVDVKKGATGKYFQLTDAALSLIDPNWWSLGMTPAQYNHTRALIEQKNALIKS
jgi:hypothetical protein